MPFKILLFNAAETLSQFESQQKLSFISILFFNTEANMDEATSDEKWEQYKQQNHKTYSRFMDVVK